MLESRSFLFVVLILCFGLFGAGCKKKGCTDEDATTYSSKAKEEDGTCRYEGSVVFWVSETTAAQMVTDGINSLYIYFDSELKGEIKLADQTYKAAPNCGAANAMTITQDLFSAKNKAFSYRVIDDNSIKRRAGAVSLNGNTCERFEILYFP